MVMMMVVLMMGGGGDSRADAHPVVRHARGRPAYPSLDGEVRHVGVDASHFLLCVVQLSGQNDHLRYNTNIPDKK